MIIKAHALLVKRQAQLLVLMQQSGWLLSKIVQ